MRVRKCKLSWFSDQVDAWKWSLVSVNSLHNHPPVRGSCTRVGEILLANHSFGRTWERSQSWLRRRTIQSVFGRNYCGGQPDHGVPEQAWVPLIFECNWVGLRAESTFEQILNICIMLSTYFVLGLWNPLMYRVVVLESPECWKHRAYSVIIVDIRDCIRKCLKRQSILE